MSRLDALLHLQTLDRLPRTGWIQHGVPAPETVGEHVLGTAFLALALAPEVEPALDTDRATVLALVHDVGEARIGDLPRSARELFPPGAKQAAERRAADELLSAVSASPVPRDRAREALDGASREARFVALCDRLQLGVRLVAYTRAGIRGLEDFVGGLETLDASEFPVCEALRRELLAALDA